MTHMSNWKRWHRTLLAAGLAGLLAIGMAACTGDDDDTADPGNEGSTPAEETSGGETPEGNGAAGDGDGDAEAQTTGFRGGVSDPPFDMPDMTLTDHNGEPINLQEQVGDGVTLFYIGYTNCPDICPTHLATAASAINQLPEDMQSQVNLIMATADPERDTPEVLQEYMTQFHPDFVGVTGSEDEMIALQQEFGFPVAEEVEDENTEEGYGLNHFAWVIAYGSDGQGHLVFPDGMSIDAWVHDLEKLVTEGFPEDA